MPGATYTSMFNLAGSCNDCHNHPAYGLAQVIAERREGRYSGPALADAGSLPPGVGLLDGA